MEHITTIAAIFLACTFMYVTSLPVTEGEDISKLADLLGKLKTIHRKRMDSPKWADFKSTSGTLGSQLPDIDNSPDDLEADGMSPSLTDDIGGVRKRQGAWSYDYGLGGGRFGKRNYGDYGIGGGRFGRDLDHVDVSD